MSIDISSLTQQMAAQAIYDEAWLIGLEIQSAEAFPITLIAFRQVLAGGTPEARRAAAFWLSDEAEHVPADLLLEMAADADEEIRFHAAYCLSYARHERTLPMLRQLLLEDDAEDVRQTAAQSLYGAAHINDVFDDEVFGYLQTAFNQDTSAKVREEVVISLANFLKSSMLAEAITLLEAAQNDADALVRDQAVISLSVLRDETWHEHEDPIALGEELR